MLIGKWLVLHELTQVKAAANGKTRLEIYEQPISATPVHFMALVSGVELPMSGLGSSAQ